MGSSTKPRTTSESQGRADRKANGRRQEKNDLEQYASHWSRRLRNLNSLPGLRLLHDVTLCGSLHRLIGRVLGIGGNNKFLSPHKPTALPCRVRRKSGFRMVNQHLIAIMRTPVCASGRDFWQLERTREAKPAILPQVGTDSPLGGFRPHDSTLNPKNPTLLLKAYAPHLPT